MVEIVLELLAVQLVRLQQAVAQQLEWLAMVYVLKRNSSFAGQLQRMRHSVFACIVLDCALLALVHQRPEYFAPIHFS